MKIAVLTLALFATASAGGGEKLLVASGDALVAKGGIPARVSVPGFTVLAPEHRDARFADHPWRVSLGALTKGDEAVMVHAERVADASGASNYAKLAESDWPWAGAHIRSMCADIAADDIAEEHDLGYLNARGWSPAGTLALEQHFVTTADHNQEIVVSLIVRGMHCDDAAGIRAAMTALRSKVSVTHMRR